VRAGRVLERVDGCRSDPGSLMVLSEHILKPYPLCFDDINRDSYRKPNPEHRWGCKPSAQPPNQSQPSHHQLISSLNACWTAMGLLRNAALKGATPLCRCIQLFIWDFTCLSNNMCMLDVHVFFNTILIKQNYGCPAQGDAVMCIKVTNCAKPLPENRM